MDEPDEQCGHKRAADAAQATRNHDYKGFDDHVHVHLQMRRFARQLQRTSQASQRTTKDYSPQHHWFGIYTQG